MSPLGSIGNHQLATLSRADSNHPNHTIKGIPVGQFLRLGHVCSDKSTFLKKASSKTPADKNMEMFKCCLKASNRCLTEPPLSVGHCPLACIQAGPIAHIGYNSKDRSDVGAMVARTVHTYYVMT